MTDVKDAFPVEIDAAQAEIFEQQQRELDKYKTRYLYLPFQDAHCCSQVQGGFVPAGVIFPVVAPKDKVNVRLLPDGAQVLQVVSPSAGIPGPKREADKDPRYEALLKKIEAMEEKMRLGVQEPANIAIYLHEVAPIVSTVLSYHGYEGAIEVTALKGMPANAFETYKINDAIFGLEPSRPATLAAVTERMNTVIEKASSSKGQAGAVLAEVAKQIMWSVQACDRFCRDHIRQRHLEMEDPQNDAPKRYSRRDLRALDLTGQPRRYEYMEVEAANRKKAEAEAAQREQQLIESIQRREDQLAGVLAEMAQVMKAQTEASKAQAEALKALSSKK